MRHVDVSGAGLSRQCTLVEQLGERVMIGVTVPLAFGVIHNLFCLFSPEDTLNDGQCHVGAYRRAR